MVICELCYEYIHDFPREWDDVLGYWVCLKCQVRALEEFGNPWRVYISPGIYQTNRQDKRKRFHVQWSTSFTYKQIKMEATDPRCYFPCSICNKPMKPGDLITLVPMGPGLQKIEQLKAKNKSTYHAIALQTHYLCATGIKPKTD